MAQTTFSNEKVEVQYNQQKKSLVVAYLLWLLLGGAGVQYFYCKRADLGLGMICLLLVSTAIPQLLLPIFFIAVMGGILLTFFVVEDANKKLLKDCEIMFGDECTDEIN